MESEDGMMDDPLEGIEELVSSAGEPVDLESQMSELILEAYGLLERVRMRKRPDLSSPAGWRLVEEQFTRWTEAGEIEAGVELRLRRLCAKWRHLMTMLGFQASTRPVWNT